MTILPASHWKLSEREFLKPFLSIGDAIRILIMIYNNPATSGVDMSPELLVRMFETIDNLTMVKGSTGDLSRMLRAAAGCLSTTALIRCCWTHCRQGPPVGARQGRVCAHSPASTCTAQYARANCQGHKPFTLGSSRC